MQVTPRFLLDMFRDDNKIRVNVLEGAPSDATVTRAYIEDMGTPTGIIINLVIQSEAFDPVPEGHEIPRLKPSLEEVYE